MNINEHFVLHLNASSGEVEIVTNATLDYETIRCYFINITAEDNGVPSLSK